MKKFYEIKLKNGSVYSISEAEHKKLLSILSRPRMEQPVFITISDNEATLKVDYIGEMYREGRGKKESYEV